MHVIERRTKIPEYLKQCQEQLVSAIKDYYNDNTGMVHYKEFIEDLRREDFSSDN